MTAGHPSTTPGPAKAPLAPLPDEDGSRAWLRRQRLDRAPGPQQGETSREQRAALRQARQLRREWLALLARVTVLDGSPASAWLDPVPTPPAANQAATPAGAANRQLLANAQAELRRGIRELLGLRLAQPVRQPASPSPATSATSTSGAANRLAATPGRPAGLVLGRFDQLGIVPPRPATGHPAPEAFALVHRLGPDGQASLLLAADQPTGLLQGIFKLLEQIDLRRHPAGLDLHEAPANALRMLDHWDNMDGSVERGYAGQSLFFDQGRIRSSRADRQRLAGYARLLASIGINAVSINNVNVHSTETGLILDHLLPHVAGLADLFRAWGIQLFLSANYAAPLHTGDLATADPLDPAVADWWLRRCQAIYRAIPDFGGFVVKADSEGRPGPFTYGRSHADGANLLARALAPHGGLVVWRCFVYNCRQDWRDRKTDRARAAWDHFMPLDGQFAPNVLLQIKNGPIDFQTREATSPLFGSLEATNQLLELQITQEYTGQQRHVCCLLPQWKEYLDFPTHWQGDGQPPRPDGSPIHRIVSGELTRRPLGGLAAVANTGTDPNWCGHHLAQVNLWGYGRLCWNPGLDASQLVDEWTRLSFGHDPELVQGISHILKTSWQTYEGYTAPLGVGFMVNPGHHYGPNVDGYEYDRWGTYHFADRDGIGVDRTRASGTGYTGQYQKPNAERYEDLATCPDELLLFFHHVPWTHRLHSGTTVIQHIYNRHFEAAAAAQAYLELWDSLAGRLDARRHREIRQRLEHQAWHAREWRDQINTYCWRKSGIPDAAGRTIY